MREGFSWFDECDERGRQNSEFQPEVNMMIEGKIEGMIEGMIEGGMSEGKIERRMVEKKIEGKIVVGYMVDSTAR
jgi:hypothetical protein